MTTWTTWHWFVKVKLVSDEFHCGAGLLEGLHVSDIDVEARTVDLWDLRPDSVPSEGDPDWDAWEKDVTGLPVRPIVHGVPYEMLHLCHPQHPQSRDPEHWRVAEPGEDPRTMYEVGALSWWGPAE